MTSTPITDPRWLSRVRDLAHDLRNPLTANRNYSELLTIHSDASVQVLRLAEQIAKFTDQLTRMLSETIRLYEILETDCPVAEQCSLEDAFHLSHEQLADLYDVPVALELQFTDRPPNVRAYTPWLAEICTQFLRYTGAAWSQSG